MLSQMDTTEYYKLMRNAGKTLHAKVMNVVPRNVFLTAAGEFRFMKKGILVCDQSDLDVLADRLFYDKRWQGMGVVEHYIEENGEGSMSGPEKEFYEAMKTSRFSLFKVKGTRDVCSVILADRLYPDPSDITLVDINLSRTVTPDMLFATRLLNFGQFCMTSGVGYPFDWEDEKKILDYLRGKELGKSKKRKDIPGDYPVYFYRLHKTVGHAIEFADV